MNLFTQLLFNGLSIGCSIAIISLSFGIIYHTTRTFHVAHSIVFVSSAYLGFYLFSILKLNILFVIVLCSAWAIFIGVSIYYFFYKPIYKKNGSQLVVFIISLAVSIIGENIISLIFGPDPKQLAQSFLTNPIKLGTIIVSYLDFFTILYAVFAFTIIVFYLNKTKIGRMIKATASDPELAVCKGINVERIYLTTYAFGSLMVMPAGILIGLRGSITPGMGSSLNLIGVMAVIFGGIGNPIGAFLAAIILGTIRNISLLIIDASWLSTLTFGIFLIVILILPTGIFGERIKK